MSAFGDTLDEHEPPYDDLAQQPKTLTKSRHMHDGKVMYVAGRMPADGSQDIDVMFVTTSVDEDEATTRSKSMFGFNINQPAEYLKGPTGVLKDVALRAGLDIDKCYYTALCKWLLPRVKRNSPPVKVCKWGLPVLMDEIARIKPKIVVCLGKHAFDLLSDRKLNFKDAHGGWLWSTEANCHLYLMHSPWSLISKPEMYEMFRVDFSEIERKRQILLGNAIENLPIRSEYIDNEQDLRDWVERRIEDKHFLQCVDGEWHDRTHVDGQLRTFQFAYTESDAMLLEFRDETNNFSFEFAAGTLLELTRLKPDAGASGEEREKELERLKYLEIGEILKPLLHRSEFRYIGHHISADWPWLVCSLGIDVWGRCVMDTEFAQQALDEASELGLERGVAMRYTTLGLYNLDLVLWKKDNKKLCEDGYGFIPSSILYPYAINDVIAPFRAYPIILKQLEYQQLLHYHNTILLPFVSDVFSDFVVTGLPMDVSMMDDLRELFHFSKGVLEVEFRKTMIVRAASLLRNNLVNEVGIKDGLSLYASITTKDMYESLEVVKDVVDLKDMSKWINLLGHYYDAPNFNIRSPDQMRRWIFDVEKLEPIKSTNQKAKGLPSQSWEKVMDLPEDRRKMFTPAVDKQTLQILSSNLKELTELLELNAVGNLCKAFLKESEEYFDEDLDEMVTEENGLHKWLASDNSIHGQMSLTGTGRPRSWMPNTLNWPSYVNENIGRAITRALATAVKDGSLPDSLRKWADIKSEKDLPSIRSCVTAPAGYILVESDYATAEMVALAKISGDKDLQRILEEPDPEWAELKSGNVWGAKYVRVRFAATAQTGIPEHKHEATFILNLWKDGVHIAVVTEDDLARNADGTVKHRGYDIHWSIAERIYERPREEMVEKVFRNAAKVINFCAPACAGIMTHRGVMRLGNVQVTDRIWDGNEFVPHGGVIRQGTRCVVTYDDASLTPEHVVWVEDGRKMTLLDAAFLGLKLLDATASRKGRITTACLSHQGEDLLRWRVAEIRKVFESADRDVGEFCNALLRAKQLFHRELELPDVKVFGVVDVFDILNAGPDQRFTAYGKLVSNSSAYGATAGSLERKIESDTGVKPEEGVGQKGLDAIATRQPRATAFLEEMAEIPKSKGYYRAASGRICHCVTHSASSGVGWRQRNSTESALGRELKNFPMQESVASTAARAGRMLRRLYLKLGMKAKVITILYDSVVTLCPLEERFVVARLHTLCMSEMNTWDYDDELSGKRTLKYSVDNEFNYRWSTRPSKSEQATLDDETHHPTPDRVKWTLTYENWELLVS